MSKAKLTIQDHRRAAKALVTMQRELSKMFTPPLNAHPRKVTAQLMKIEGGIRQAKSLLEDEMFKAHKGKLPDDACDIYYPNALEKMLTTF